MFSEMLKLAHGFVLKRWFFFPSLKHLQVVPASEVGPVSPFPAQRSELRPVLTCRFVHVLPAPLVSLDYPVPQRELAQLHLDVQHQVELHLGDDTLAATGARLACAIHSVNRHSLASARPSRGLRAQERDDRHTTAREAQRLVKETEEERNASNSAPECEQAGGRLLQSETSSWMWRWGPGTGRIGSAPHMWSLKLRHSVREWPGATLLLSEHLKADAHFGGLAVSINNLFKGKASKS